MGSFPARVTLGRSGMAVGPLCLAGGYGIGAGGVLRAFDRGVNYFYHGTKRSPGMAAAIRDLVAGGHRDELVIVLQSYSRWSWWLERSLRQGLLELGLDHADVLLLGWFNHMPSRSLLDRATRLREAGMIRHLAISSHRRPAFVAFANDGPFSVLHIRYNAAHTGAENDIFPHLPKADRPGIVAYTATRWGSLLNAAKMPPGERPLRGRDAYRFVLSNPDFDACLCGPRNDVELDEALASLDEGPLTAEEESRIRAIGRHVHARGWLR